MIKSPGPQHRLIDARGNIDTRWLRWLEQSFGAANAADLSSALAELAARVDALSGGRAIIGRGSVQVNGENTLYVTLRGDADNPGQGFLYGTDSTGAKGWQRVYDVINGDPDDFIVTDSGYVVLGEVAAPADLPPSGNDGEAWRVIEESPGLYAWDGSAFTLDPSATGIVGLALAPVPDSGTGTLQKTAFDSKGRKTGTASATTTDLPEGDNLYYTDTRADARVDAGIAAHVAEPNPHPQYALAASVTGSMPTRIPAGQTYTVPADTQALWTLPIELEAGASIEALGDLVEVN